MAIAQVTCNCKKCGNIFQHRHECRSRKEADNYEIWASANVDICPTCYAEQRKTQEAAKTSEVSAKLPRLVGSEKQIAWAEKLRREAIERNVSAKALMANIDQLPAIIDNVNRAAAARGENDPEVVECRKVLRLFSETSAKWFIEHR